MDVNAGEGAGGSGVNARAVSSSAPGSAPVVTVAATASGGYGRRPMAAPRSALDMRRSELNMERMIKKNAQAVRRPGGKKRVQEVMEFFKNKQKQGGEDGGSATASNASSADDGERSAKRKRTSLVDHALLTGGRNTVPAALASPVRRSSGNTTSTSAPGVAFTSPTRRQTQRSPARKTASPARVRVRDTEAVPMHLSSPVRPPHSATMASPKRPARNVNGASPLRRSEFLNSPLRHRASASPKRPLVFTSAMDESTGSASMETAPSTLVNGHPPLLSSALEQIELAPTTKSKPSVSTAKSPFQSFQSKFKRSPARAGPTISTGSTGNSQARTGPTVVDLSRSQDVSTPSPPAASAPASSTQAATSSTASAGSGAAIAASSEPTTVSTLVSPPPAPKPARKLFSKRVTAHRSLCFSTEGVATSVDVSPGGEVIVVGFTDGSVRLYGMDSSVPSDRHGYLLGHIDEESSAGSSNANLTVKISPDGRYAFVGCRQGPRVIMSINLHNYRNDRGYAEGDDEEFEQFQKHFYSRANLRGFADVTTYVPPGGDQGAEVQTNKRYAYYLLTGLGVGNLNLWLFTEGTRQHQEPTWDHLQVFQSGSNTALTAAFLPSTSSPGALAIAAASKERMRVWPMEFKKSSPAETTESNDGSATETEETMAELLGGTHTVVSHYNIPNTAGIVAFHGQFAYGITLTGEAYRIRLPDAADMRTTSGTPTRQTFELEKLDTGGSGKSRRSTIMLESVAASKDGKTLIAVSSDGIFYYSNQLPEVDASDAPILRIIGKNASLNQLYKTPMKVYTPEISSNDATETPHAETMMAVMTNPSGEEGSDDADRGYFNVDPTEVFAARWMVPSRGQNCWVCGVRNVCHWQGPPRDLQLKPRTAAIADPGAMKKARAKVKDRRERRASREALRESSAPNTPSNKKAKITPRKSAPQRQKTTPASTAAPAVASWTQPVPDLTPNGSTQRKVDTGDVSEHEEDSPSVEKLTTELEHYKKRYREVKGELMRRLRTEGQLRRKFKKNEEEFMEQLNDSLRKLDAAEDRVAELKILQRDAEKRYAFEKVRSEQENSVKARYEQLCEQMHDKMALVVDQKRLLEQTTRTLISEVDRNVHALKNAVVLEKSECVVCKDRQSVTAVVPCGHLCFCEQDGETYRRNCNSENPTCPICQQEIVSLLRIY